MDGTLLGAILIPTGDNIPKASADYIFAGIVDGVFLLAGIVAVIGLLLNGFRFITANGDSGKVAKAKQGVLYSVVGIMVVVVGFGMVRLVIRPY
ncbi:hypothetical protein TM7_0585 [candidate division TM7 genomosp. GTL1]|nr:hypothetical protein TM7_0585 [candidate division TM7 genomosp. GTL1]